MIEATARVALVGLFLCQIGACDRSPTPSTPALTQPSPASPSSAAPLASSATRTVTAGRWTVTWTSARAVARRQGHAPLTLYDHVEDKQGCVESVAKIRRENPEWATEMDASYTGAERVVAVVGTFITTAIDYDGYCGGAHPFHRRSFDTVDLAAGGKAVTLEGLFGSTTRTAIDGHAGLRRALGEDAQVVGEPWTTPHFAIKAVEGDQVVVRLGLPHAVEADAGTLGLFDIRLPVPAHLKSKLLRAKEAGTLLTGLAPEFARRPEGVSRD